MGPPGVRAGTIEARRGGGNEACVADAGSGDVERGKFLRYGEIAQIAPEREVPRDIGYRGREEVREVAFERETFAHFSERGHDVDRLIFRWREGREEFIGFAAHASPP